MTGKQNFPERRETRKLRKVIVIVRHSSQRDNWYLHFELTPSEEWLRERKNKILFSPVNFHNNTEYFKLPGIKWVSDCSVSDPSTSTSISSSSDSSCALSTTTVGSTDVEWITGSSSEMILSSRTCCICTSETKIVSLDCPSLASPDCAKVLFCRNEKEQCSFSWAGKGRASAKRKVDSGEKGKKTTTSAAFIQLAPWSKLDKRSEGLRAD